ncbi:MAG TPA: OmpA family protein, partial [Acetobacteraceae bacterium]|nr:OmpA family protein [Acetobacteraceae bacterium]
HWEGVDAPYRPKRTRFPVWVALCGAIALVAGGFVWVLRELNRASDQFYETALAAPPAAMPVIARPPFVRPPPPPPEPPAPGPADRLRAALASEIRQKELNVVATPSATILRLPAAKLFGAQNATLARGAGPLLERVGQALKGEPGKLLVLGYTDNQPVRTVNFPSNFALSKARAEAVRTALAKPVGEGRLTAEGRAEADPVAPNTSAQGREENRRIDIVLQR